MDSIVNKCAAHPNKMMTCPYNKAHQLEQYRMHIHLEKCRKQYPGSAKSPCPFNRTHIVNDAEMDYHVKQCPDRLTLDKEQYSVANTQEYRHLAEIPSVASHEDNWDDENCDSYQPEAKPGAHIIRKMKCATPSEKRQARMSNVKNYKPGNSQ